MATDLDFLTIYDSICALDNQILENNQAVNPDLFSENKDLPLLKNLQPNLLSNFAKPLPLSSSQPIAIGKLPSDPEIICYDHFHTSFGKLLIAASKLGICYVSFSSDDNLNELQKYFPNSELKNMKTEVHKTAIDFLKNKSNTTLFLHVKGTEFQLQVWKNLLKIPRGQLSTYKYIGLAIGKPTASRAIGAAIGKNPIALFIPCHRVIRSTGVWKGFRWGNKRKAALLLYELM